MPKPDDDIILRVTREAQRLETRRFIDQLIQERRAQLQERDQEGVS